MSRKKPYFSIIIPTLNEAKYLPKLLKDLQKQTYKDFEVLVVDGQSEDQTVKKAQSFNSLNPKVINSPKRHVSFQRNLGAKNAQGEVLIFFDADNQIPPFFLVGIKYQYEKTQPDVFTSYIKADTKRTPDKVAASVMNVAIEAMSRLEDSAWAFGAFTACSPKVFKKIGGFDETVKYAEDRLFIQEALKKGLTFKVFKEPKYTYSFRRIRKEGKLNLLYRSTKLTLKLLKEGKAKGADDDYPMVGGGFYEQDSKKSKKIGKKLEKAFQDLEKLFSRS